MDITPDELKKREMEAMFIAYGHKKDLEKNTLVLARSEFDKMISNFKLPKKVSKKGELDKKPSMKAAPKKIANKKKTAIELFEKLKNRKKKGSLNELP